MDHNHVSEEVIQANLRSILRISEGKEEATVKEASAGGLRHFVSNDQTGRSIHIPKAFNAIRTRIEAILMGECGEECKSEVKALAWELEALRSGYLAGVASRNPYPDWHRLQALAREVKASPDLENLNMLLDMTEDLVSSGKRQLGDAFALQDAILALEHLGDAKYHPDHFERSRELWNQPGYRVHRALQFQLKNRACLVDKWKELLERWNGDQDQLGMYSKDRPVL
ncbi:hypothetical protein FRC00_008032 [Tulasnella sp. 408]|nr:hypothetical protein FRC00_008032 [Tulasnella sp. 408]